MKSKIILRAVIMSLFILAGNSTFAQEDVIKRDTLAPVIITSTTSVNKKVSDAFDKDFKNAVSPRWYSINKNYLVKFMVEDQRNSALYNKNGYQIYHISYGTEKHLPMDVKDLIKSQYKDGKISTVIHVDQNNRSIWIANLEEGNSLVLARVENGELDEVERVKNASAGNQ